MILTIKHSLRQCYSQGGPDIQIQTGVLKTSTKESTW